MSETPPFDAYHELLGIAPSEQPPTLYRLLGVTTFESVPTVIERAADRQMAHLRTFQAGKHQADSQRLLNEVTRARQTLLNEKERNAYEAKLKQVQATRTAATTAKPLKVAAPLAAPKPVAVPVTVAKPANAPQSVELPQVTPSHVQTAANPLTSAPHTTKSRSATPRKKNNVPLVIGGASAVVLVLGVIGLVIAMSQGGDDTPLTVTKAETKPQHTTPRGSPENSGGSTAEKKSVPQKSSLPTNPPAVTPLLPATQTLPIAPAITPPTQLKPVTPSEDIEIPQPTPPPEAPPNVENSRDPPADSSSPDSAAAKKVEIDKAEFDRMRTSLREAVKDTADAEKVDAIIAFAGDPEIIKSPAATKAVLAEALVQSLTTKDIRRAQTTLRRIHDAAQLFAESEYKASVTRVKDLAVASGERALAFTYIDELRERQLLTPAEASAEKAAALNIAAQDKSLKKPGNQAQRQELADEMVTLAVAAAEVNPEVAEDLLVEARKTAGAITDRERRASFEREISVAKTAAGEAKRYQQALEQLKKDPQDASAQKVRIDVLLNRGQAKEVLAELAGSEHPLQGLAQETVSLLQQGSNPSGKAAFSCALRWAKAADEVQSLKQAGFQQVARELSTLAISAQNEPLDPFALQRAKQLEATVSSIMPAVAERPASPKPSSTDSKSKVELLGAGAKTSVVKGKVDRTKEAIVAERGIFEFDQPLSEKSYRLVAQFARTGGSDTLGFTIPVGTRAVTVVFGCYNNTTHGLSDLEQGGPDRNPTGVRGTIDNNRIYTAQIDVQQVTETDYRIVVLLDGAKVIDWQGSQDRLVPSGQTEYAASSQRKLAVGATKATMEVRSLELSVPTAASSKTAKGKPLPFNKWVDLFQLVNLDEDCERGYWAPGSGNSIEVQSNPFSILRMPVLLTNCSYDLAVEFKLAGDHDQIHVLLPVGDRVALLVVDGYEHAKMSYFEMIAGQKAMDNKDVVRENLLDPNQTYRYVINVRLKGERATLTFNLNGKKVFDHEGPIAELNTLAVWDMRTNAQPALAPHDTRMTFLNCQVRPVSGEASLGRDVPLLEQIPDKVLARKATPLTSLPHLELKHHDNHFGISKGPHTPFIGGKECPDYIYIHAPSRITYAIPPNAKYFTTISYCPMSSHVNFIVKVDGKELFSRARRPITPIVLELPPGGKVLELECDSLGELVRDNAFWCYPAFR